MTGPERAEVRTVAGLAALTLAVLASAPPLIGWWWGLRLTAAVFLVLMVACMTVSVRRYRRDGGRW